MSFHRLFPINESTFAIRCITVSSLSIFIIMCTEEVILGVGLLPQSLPCTVFLFIGQEVCVGYHGKITHQPLTPSSQLSKGTFSGLLIGQSFLLWISIKIRRSSLLLPPSPCPARLWRENKSLFYKAGSTTMTHRVVRKMKANWRTPRRVIGQVCVR